MTQTPLPSSTAEAPSLADTARWMVVIACAFFLLRELGPILKPLFLAVLVGYVVLPIHLWVKRYVPGRLSLAASAILSLILILLLTIGIQATIRTLADQLPTLNAKGVQMRDDFLAWAEFAGRFRRSGPTGSCTRSTASTAASPTISRPSSKRA
jgi:predicted PurR-regulated permease PerM